MPTSSTRMLATTEAVSEAAGSSRADDLHDLVKLHEARNVATCSGVVYRSALDRTESREQFFREDFPMTDPALVLLARRHAGDRREGRLRPAGLSDRRHPIHAAGARSRRPRPDRRDHPRRARSAGARMSEFSRRQADHRRRYLHRLRPVRHRLPGRRHPHGRRERQAGRSPIRATARSATSARTIARPTASASVTTSAIRAATAPTTSSAWTSSTAEAQLRVCLLTGPLACTRADSRRSCAPDIWPNAE